MKQIPSILLALVAVLGSATIAAAQTTAYVGATIETASSDGRLDNATLVVEGNKIVDVGTDIEIPDGARVVSVSGKTIMPGIIDPYFVYATSGASAGTRTITFRGRTFTVPNRGPFNSGSFKKIGEYFFPFKFDFKPAVRSGITNANLVSDGRGLSAFANLTTEPTPEMLFAKEGRLFAKVTNQTSALDVIRKPLKVDDKAKSSTAKTTTSRSSSTDPTKKYWDAVKSGQQRVFVNMNNSAAVAYVLQVAKNNPKAKVVMVATGGNLYPCLDQMEALDNVSVVLQPGIDTVPFTRDLMNVSQMLQERKIPFALSLSLAGSQLKSSQDDPMFPVATLVRTGLKRNLAIEAMTIKAAEMLGLEKTHGSIAKNKHANFLIFDGDPLATGSRLEQIFVDGKLIHEN